MKRLTYLLALLFLVPLTDLHAQRTFLQRLYPDVSLGIMPADNQANAQLIGGLGYAISQTHGLAINYNVEAGGNVYNSRVLRGPSLNYRYATNFGLLLKLGVG